jgi:hypothetical protein
VAHGEAGQVPQTNKAERKGDRLASRAGAGVDVGAGHCVRSSEMIYDLQALKTQPALAELLDVLIANQYTYMSTLALLENGILSPAAGIARLKERGVIVETNYQSIVDRSGRTRKRIACYKIVGGVVL